MKKTLVIFLSLIIACLVGTKVFADETGYISTSATSQVELIPDVVNFDVEIITTSKESIAKAVEENKTISTKVYENLKKTIDKNNGDSLKTSNYNATPIYKYTNNKKVLEYYQVTNTIKVKTKNITKAGQIIDNVISDGATSVNNVSYDISDYESASNDLLAKTSVKAKEQAETIAKSIGAEITGIKSIDGSCSLSGKTIMPRMFSAVKSTALSDNGESKQSTSLEVGTMTLTSRVNINFFVK